MAPPKKHSIYTRKTASCARDRAVHHGRVCFFSDKGTVELINENHYSNYVMGFSTYKWYGTLRLHCNAVVGVHRKKSALLRTL